MAYKVPENFDALMQECRGELSQICFGPYDIQVSCGGWRIQTFTTFDYHTKGKTHRASAQEKEGKEILLHALGSNIENIKRLDSQSFSIDLSNGDKMVLFEDMPSYDCVIIHKPGASDFIVI